MAILQPYCSFSAQVNLQKEITFNISSRNHENRNYYIELIKRSLESEGYLVTFNDLGISNTRRQKKDLNENKLSLMWRLKTPLRDKSFMRVNIGLSNGLIAQRILFIKNKNKNKNKHAFENITNIEDFRKRNLVVAGLILTFGTIIICHIFSS